MAVSGWFVVGLVLGVLTVAVLVVAGKGDRDGRAGEDETGADRWGGGV